MPIASDCIMDGIRERSTDPESLNMTGFADVEGSTVSPTPTRTSLPEPRRRCAACEQEIQPPNLELECHADDGRTVLVMARITWPGLTLVPSRRGATGGRLDRTQTDSEFCHRRP